MRQKILFICKKRVDSYGVSYGLINSAKFVANALAEHNYETKVVSVADNNCIDKEVCNYKPTHVMIEALWVVPEKLEILHRLHPNVIWAIRIHSKTPFLSNEGHAIEWARKYDEMPWVTLAPNSLELHGNLLAAGLRSIYLPNIYCAPSGRQLPSQGNDVINVGCFGAIRPLKNHLMQAMSAIRFASSIRKRLRFHVNADRIEQRGESVLSNLRALFAGTENELVEHPWMLHSDFLKVVRSMDIGMQVSLSESFNIVAADFVSNGVPIVTSKDVDWMPWLYTANPNSPESIIMTMRTAWNLKLLRVHELCRFALWSSNRLALAAWIDFLK